MALQCAPALSGLGIPQANCAVVAARGHGAAVGAQGHTSDSVSMPLQGVDQGAGLIQATQLGHPTRATQQSLGTLQKTVQRERAINKVCAVVFDVQAGQFLHQLPPALVEPLLRGWRQSIVSAGLPVQQWGDVGHARSDASEQLRNELVGVLAQDVRDHRQGAVQACGGGVGAVAQKVVAQQGLNAAEVQARLYPVEVQQQLVQPFLLGSQSQVRRHVADEVGVGVDPVA